LRSETSSYPKSEVAGVHIWGDERGRPGQVEWRWLPPKPFPARPCPSGKFTKLIDAILSFDIMTTSVVIQKDPDMKYIFPMLAALSVAACAAIPDATTSPCVALRIDCTESENILIIGKAEEQADLLQQAVAASEKFEKLFNKTPGKTVIMPGGTISPDHYKTFEASGYSVKLPWISAADKAALREASIRRQVEEQTKDLPEAVKATAMAQALAAAGSPKTDPSDTTQAGAFSHELGHLWFIDAFKPADSAAQTGHAYGGWAPDWLDETAAILMENSELAESRREDFLNVPDEEIVPLMTFLTMEHPAAQSAKFLNERFRKTEGQTESRTTVLTGDDAKEFLKNSGGNSAANFYAQSKAFSDFLLSYSDDTQIYTSLTNDLLEGSSFESWLMSEGAVWGLPTTLTELDKSWQAWIARQR